MKWSGVFGAALVGAPAGYSAPELTAHAPPDSSNAAIIARVAMDRPGVIDVSKLISADSIGGSAPEKYGLPCDRFRHRESDLLPTSSVTLAPASAYSRFKASGSRHVAARERHPIPHDVGHVQLIRLDSPETPLLGGQDLQIRG